jgi:hypothetical protein
MSTRTSWIIWLVVILVLPTGCSEEESAPPSGPDSDLVSVTGAVARIVNDIPVDGDATVDIMLENGKTEIFYLPSLWGNEWTPEQNEAYRVYRELKIGDRVNAVGTRMKHRIELKTLTIL